MQVWRSAVHIRAFPVASCLCSYACVMFSCRCGGVVLLLLLVLLRRCYMSSPWLYHNRSFSLLFVLFLFCCFFLFFLYHCCPCFLFLFVLFCCCCFLLFSFLFLCLFIFLYNHTYKDIHTIAYTGEVQTSKNTYMDYIETHIQGLHRNIHTGRCR